MAIQMAVAIQMGGHSDGGGGWGYNSAKAYKCKSIKHRKYGGCKRANVQTCKR